MFCVGATSNRSKYWASLL